MYSIDQLKAATEKAREEHNFCLFRNYTEDLPTWEDVINHLNNRAIYGEKIPVTEGQSMGGVSFIENFEFQVNQCIEFKHMQDLQNTFDQVFEGLYEEPALSGGIFMDLIERKEKPGGIGMHPDPSNNLHLQCIGRTKWELSKEKNGQVETIILEPGDLIYIPDGVYHKVTSLTPRAGMVLVYGLRRGITNNGDTIRDK